MAGIHLWPRVTLTSWPQSLPFHALATQTLVPTCIKITSFSFFCILKFGRTSLTNKWTDRLRTLCRCRTSTPARLAWRRYSTSAPAHLAWRRYREVVQHYTLVPPLESCIRLPMRQPQHWLCEGGMCLPARYRYRYSLGFDEWRLSYRLRYTCLTLKNITTLNLGQGHSRSFEMARFDGLHTHSYSSSTVTKATCCIISEI